MGIGQIPRIYRGLMDKRKKRLANEAELRTRLGSLEREIYFYFRKIKGSDKYISVGQVQKLLERGGLELSKRYIRQLAQRGDIYHHRLPVSSSIRMYLFKERWLYSWLRKLERRGMELLREKNLQAKSSIDKMLGRR